MKLIFFLISVAALPVFGQGTFVNLNFESPNLPCISNLTGALVPTSDAFPGWTVRYGDTVRDQVFYNGIVVVPSVMLWTREFNGIPGHPSFGNFSAVWNGNPSGISP